MEKDVLISYFNSISTNSTPKLFCQVMDETKSTKHQLAISAIRQAVKDNDLTTANKIKSSLPAFTSSGVFEPSHAATDLKAYSGFICLDIDKLHKDQVEPVKWKSKSISFTLACFVSPSGNGLKIFVKVKGGREDHEKNFYAAVDYYTKALEVQFDLSGKNINRLCFVSHDPDLYYNNESEVFDISGAEMSSHHIQNPIYHLNYSFFRNHFELTPDLHQECFEYCVWLSEKKYRFEEGSRNAFVYYLACSMNRHAMPLEAAQRLILDNFLFDDEKSLIATIKSAYKHNSFQFGAYSYIPRNSDTTGTIEEMPSSMLMDRYSNSTKNLKLTPYIPNEIYYSLPKLMKDCVTPFDDFREKDVVITGILVCISALIQDITFIYDGRLHYPNLFGYVIAPPGSGKGKMDYSIKLVNYTQRVMYEKYMSDQNAYNLDLKTYKQRSKKDTNINPPEKIPMKLIRLPGNVSLAALMEFLADNNGRGLIAEPESKPIITAIRQDWGGWEYVLLQCNPNESLSSLRKSDKEYKNIDSPRLSFLISSTVNQIPEIIRSRGDGFLSRFLYYIFDSEPIWHSVTQQDHGKSFTEIFEKFSEEFYWFHLFYKDRKVRFRLTPEQKEIFDEIFNNLLSHYHDLYNVEETRSIIFRAGLAAQRIMVVLTALTYYEHDIVDEILQCTESDFDIGIQLIQTYLQHAFVVMQQLPYAANQHPYSRRPKFEFPSGEFTRAEAIELGKQLGYSERTVDERLKTDISLMQLSHGLYKNISKNDTN